MKLKLKSIGIAHAPVGLFLLVFLVQMVSAETQFTNEFWISTVVQTNGGVNGVYGNGTLDCPYDGSTQTKFDVAMNNLPPNSTIHTNVIIIGNTMRFDGLGTGDGIDALQNTGMLIVNNVMDSNVTNHFYNSSGINIDNNYDFAGNYLNNLNVPMIGSTPVTSFGLSLVGSAGASPALTALGLPSNPLVVVTNVGYNGSFVAKVVANDCVTLILKPSSYLSVTNISNSGGGLAGSSVLAWHPF